jgi:DNA-binding transcriptional LysR family regulator
LLATGRYLSVVPRSLLHFNGMRSSLKVLPVKLPIEPRPVAIITLKGRTLSPVASLFIECVREVVKPLTRLR